jgi:hypothetical protein
MQKILRREKNTYQLFSYVFVPGSKWTECRFAENFVF